MRRVFLFLLLACTNQLLFCAVAAHELDELMAHKDRQALTRFFAGNPTFSDTELSKYPLSVLGIGEKYVNDRGHEDVYRENRHNLTVHDLPILASHLLDDPERAIRIALQFGADLNDNTNMPWRFSALNNAVIANKLDQKKKLKLVKLLVVSRANPNTQNYVGFTPLLNAAHDGNVEIVKVLLEAKANPKIRHKMAREQTVTEHYAAYGEGTKAQKAKILSLLDPQKYPPQESCCLLS